MNFTDILNLSDTEIPLCANLTGSYGPRMTRYSTAAVIAQAAITITATLGLIGNAFSVIVLRMPQMKSAYSLLLCALTVSDSVQLVVYLIHFGFPLLGIANNGMDAKPHLSKTISMMAYIGLTASSYFTVLVSFERYIAVCSPFKALSLFPTKRRMLHYVGVILVFSLVFNLPKWWELDQCRDINTNELKLTKSALRTNASYRRFYVFWANVLINFFIPLLTLSFLNVFIYKGILEANKAKRTLSKGQPPKQDMSITLMLVVVVLVFCICNMLYTIIGCILYFCLACYSFRPTLIRIQNYLYSFNASVNFTIYCLCGSKFRHQLQILFDSLRKKIGCGSKVNKSSRYTVTRTSISAPTCL